MTTTFEFNITDLDEFNYRSEARRLSREYRSGEINDTRKIHEFIAHYANLLLKEHIAAECKVGTTQHNEYVIITNPQQRGPIWKEAYTLQLRKDLTHSPPDHKRIYSNDFRDYIARYICNVAEQACKIEDQIQLDRAIQAEQEAIADELEG